MIKAHLIVAIALIFHFSVNASDFNVLKEGVINDSLLVQTTTIQSVINRCAATGGGKVSFPAGKYKTGGLILRDNITLFLEAGATLIASRDTNDYKATQNNSGDIIPVLVYAKDAQNISIEGKGVIDGAATHQYGDLDAVDGFIADITENARKAGVPMKRYYHYKPYTSMIYFENCKNISVRDITLRASQFWTLHAKWTDYLTISGVKVFSDLERGINADGIDIDGCRNVTISDCFIETGDDAIVLKTTATNGVSRSCENVTVTNCVLTSSSTALKLGTESHADFRYISFSNCIIRNSNRGIGIIVRDGATAENISFSNINIECKRRHFNWWGNADPIWLVVLKRRSESKIGTIRNVSFQNIIAHAQGTSKIEGFEGKTLENITLDNVQFFMHPEDLIDKRCDDAFAANYVNSISLSNVSVKWNTQNIEPKWRNAFTFSNINDLNLNRLSGYRAPTNKGVFIDLKAVKQAFISNCNSMKKSEKNFIHKDATCEDVQLNCK